jgi:putative DNA primase/helicase
MQDDTRADVIRAYLVGLYGADPHGLLWIGGHADGWRGRAFSDIDAAVAYAVKLDDQGGTGVYHRSTTLAGIPEKRGSAADSREVSYFALDVDVAGPGHKAQNLPAGFGDVESLIEKAGFPAPTAWIFSGGGFYPQWRFAEPIDVRDDETRGWVEDAFAQISAHFIAAAGQLGWHLDNVRDLARVFRLPGTTNRKVPDEPARCVDTYLGSAETHDLGVLAALARPDRGVVHEAAPKSEAAEHPTAGTDLFDDAGRTFTREQAKQYVRTAMAKLGETPAGFNAAINNFAMACAHFPWLVSQERCAKLVIKTLGERLGWDAPDRDDIATIASAYGATAAGKSWIAIEVESTATAGPDGELTGGGQLSSPGHPMKVAREILEARERPLRWWQGAYYEHQGRHWSEISDDLIRRWIYRATEDATYIGLDSKGEPTSKAWAPTGGKVANVHDALSRGVVQTEHEPVRIMAMTNGVLDPSTRTLTDHDQETFNLSSLPFAYDPDATCPQWMQFLESTLPGDSQAHETIAEWMGYVLSGRTDLHKIGVLVGPPRCGKGTISRVLKAMVGPDGWAAPTLARLSSEFGMASLIGKGLAVMGDVRWTSKYVIDAVPIMLGISGEDGFSIPRKHVGDWIGKLPTRLMLMSNDAPVFTDASGALAGRMVYVAFHRSFLGAEDLSLEGRLMGELPGILNWALDGLDRMTALGTFTQSAGSLELAAEVDRDSSPVKAWIDDRCVVDPTCTVTLEALLSNYRDWLSAENMALSPSLNRLSRDIRSAFGDQGVTVDRKPNGAGGKHRVVNGLRVIVGGSITDLELLD